MADRNQNFAFITDRSTGQRKELCETPVCLPTEPHSERQSSPLSSQPLSRDGSACEGGHEGGPHRESSGHGEAHFILPSFITQKSHLT